MALKFEIAKSREPLLLYDTSNLELV
jgi:hypothetical protein